MNTVTLPDGRKIQFPADMNPEQMNAEIEKFLSAESAKAPAAQSLPMQAFNTVRSGFDAVGEAAQSIASMVQGGGTDERFKDTPGFSGEGLGQVPGMPNTVQGAKIVALDDTRYGEIIESALKERGLLVSAENDSSHPTNMVDERHQEQERQMEEIQNQPDLNKMFFPGGEVQLDQLSDETLYDLYKNHGLDIKKAIPEDRFNTIMDGIGANEVDGI